MDKKEYFRQYLLHNKDKIKEVKQQYRQLHKDRVRESDRLYRLENRDKIKESKRLSDTLYRIRNKDKLRETMREKYLQNHKTPNSYIPRGAVLKSWKSPNSVRKYFDSIGKELHVSNYEDWYRISRVQIRDLGGMASQFLCRYFLIFVFLSL
jgi:hypothetical protein